MFIVLIKGSNGDIFVEKKRTAFLKNFGAIPPCWMEIRPKLRDQVAA